jgi:Spy/CpxP family protein refolding chaperone
MQTTQFYKVVIIILVLLNLGTLTFLWFGKPRAGNIPDRGQSAEFLIRELTLTPSQQDNFGKLREEHRLKLTNLQEQDRILHDRFFEAVFLPGHDTLAMSILADSIASVRKQMEILTFEHFRQLRQLLSEDQKMKFHQVFRKALERVMPLPEPPGPPPPPPPPPKVTKP